MRSGDDRLVELRPGEQPELECGIAQGGVTPHSKELAHRAACQQYAMNRNANQDKKGQSMDPLRDDVAKVTEPKTPSLCEKAEGPFLKATKPTIPKKGAPKRTVEHRNKDSHEKSNEHTVQISSHRAGQ